MTRRQIRSRLWVRPLEVRVSPAVFTVLNTMDGTVSGSNQLPGSLRQAIYDAILAPGADTIDFAPAMTAGGPVSIFLNSTLTLSAANGPITIEGPGSSLLALDGKDAIQVLVNDAGVTASIAGLTVTHGRAATNGYGAGIFNVGTLTINNVAVIENSLGASSTGSNGGRGGGIYNHAMLTITNSLISDNRSGDGGVNGGSSIDAGDGGDGGGIYSSGILVISDSTVSLNYSGKGGLGSSTSFGGDGGDGGGIFNSGILTVTNCDISGNSAGAGGSSNDWGGVGGGGGGVASTGSLTIVDCNISGNRAGTGGSGESRRGGYGGGIYSTGALSVGASTITANKAGNGGFGSVGPFSSGGDGGGVWAYADALPISIHKSTVSYNSAGHGASSTDGGDGGNGGGLWISSTNLLVSDSHITNNSAGNGGNNGFAGDGGDGGGAYIDCESGSQAIVRTTISNNIAGKGGDAIVHAAAGGKGGGISVEGSTATSASFSISACEISSNLAGDAGLDTDHPHKMGRAGNGGGVSIYAFGNVNVTLANSTVSGNKSGLAGNSQSSGGGVYTRYSAPVTISNCTISANTAAYGGGGIAFLGYTSKLQSTIVAGNIAPSNPDVRGTFISLGYNLVQSPGTTTGYLPSDQTNVNPLLGSLGNYGGVTRTIPLLPGSTAIDKGSNALNLQNDQRGVSFDRVAGTAPDVGAFEVRPPVAGATAPNVFVSGGVLHTITVTYGAVDSHINIGTLGTGDVVVTGPGGFTATPTYTGVDINSNGTPRVATYQFVPPGGSWDSADTGIYQVTMKGGQVFDTSTPGPYAVLAGMLTSFIAPLTSAPLVQTISVNGGQPQRSRVTSLSVEFDQLITLPATPASAFQLKRNSDNAVVNLSASVSGNIVTLSFASGAVNGNSLADGRYTLTAIASQINEGYFDGNGDGAFGDNYVVVGNTVNQLFRLFGDNNGDGYVGPTDLMSFRLAFGGNGIAFDFNNNGSVDANDFIQFRLRFGGSI